MCDDPTRAELDEAFADLARIHRAHLAQHDVKLPGAGTARALQLAILWRCRDHEVHKDQVSRIVRREIPGAAADQQVRHLKRDGWNITGTRGRHRLAEPYRPSADHANQRARRQGRLQAETFEDVKQTFGYRCATCGAVEGEPDPRYGGAATVLQQGHQNPAGRADDRENIIPQCENCNRQYLDDFVFDDRGRVQAVNNVNPVRRAAKRVRRAIWMDLDREFGRGSGRKPKRKRRQA